MSPTAEEWRERLAAHDDVWNETVPAEGGRYADPPDGDYQGTVWGFDFIVIDDGHGQAFLKIELQVASGDHNGMVTGELFALEDRERLGYTKKALQTIGVDVDNTPLSEIYPGSPVLEAVLDVPVEFTVRRSRKINEKTGQPYVNIYITKCLGGPLRVDQDAQMGLGAHTDVPVDDRDFQPPSGPLPADDDIPF